jgi:hypothetical protein
VSKYQQPQGSRYVLWKGILAGSVGIDGDDDDDDDGNVASVGLFEKDSVVVVVVVAER